MKEPIKWYRSGTGALITQIPITIMLDHVEKDPNYHAISFVTKHKILFMGWASDNLQITTRKIWTFHTRPVENRIGGE